jgi:hypothetical protein
MPLRKNNDIVSSSVTNKKQSKKSTKQKIILPDGEALLSDADVFTTDT